MRTISADREELLTAPGRTTYLKVEIDKDGTGQLQDLTDLQGRSWVKGAKWGESYDQAVATAEVRLHREVFQLALPPLMTTSRFNASAKMLQIGRAIRISTYVGPMDEKPGPLDFELMFKGYIDDIDWGGSESVVTLRCRDEGGLLADRWIEEQKTYGTAAGRDLENVIQDIMDAWAVSPAPTLSTPSSPAFKIVAYTQEQMSVMDAIQRLAQFPGWDVRYRWTGSTFQLVLRQPTRTSPTSARTFDSDDYEDLAQVRVALSEIRNVVQVAYSSTERGTAQAGSGGSITLATTAIAIDDHYNGLRVRITAGTGSGQETGVSDYVGATRVATVSPAWTTAPDATSVYEILLSQASTTETGTAQAGGASTITLATTAQPVDGFYATKYVVTITGGTGSGQRRTITAYTGSTRVATVDAAWTTNPDATSTYRVEVGDDASITKYGRRWMQLAQDWTGSQIDTPAEARDLAYAAVLDLREPTVEHEVVGMPYFWPVQLDDYFTFKSNDVHYDTDLLTAVVGYEHSLEENGPATTRMMLRGKPSIGVGRWMRAAATPGLASTADRTGPAAPSGLSGESVGFGATGMVKVNFEPPRERDWAHSELHVSQSNPFTADGTTLKARGRSSTLWAVMGAGTWQTRVVHVDRDGNKSAAGALTEVIVPAIVNTAAPTQGIGGGNTEGTASTYARSNHDHKLRETGGPTDLTIAAIADGKFLKRSGTTIIGADAGGGSVTQLAFAEANQAIFPTTAPAGRTVVNDRPTIAFDPTTDESVIFEIIVSRDYAAGGALTVDLDWAANATTGDARWDVQFERVLAGTDNINADSFAAAQSATTTTAGTAYVLNRTSIAFTNAQADGIAAGDALRIKITRDAYHAADTLAVDALLYRLIVRQ